MVQLTHSSDFVPKTPVAPKSEFNIVTEGNIVFEPEEILASTTPMTGMH